MMMRVMLTVDAQQLDIRFKLNRDVLTLTI